MPRPKKDKGLMRVQLRLSPRCLEMCDRFSSEEMSEVVERAIAAGIRPGRNLGAQVQALIRPEKMRCDSIARISLTGGHDQIQIVFPEKRDDFRNVVRSYRYNWNDWCWAKSVKAEDACDRAAEIAHELLLKGFAVQVDHSEIRDKAVTGQFIPEPLRIIKVGTSGVYKGWFQFDYPRTDDFYNELMKLTAAKYVDKHVRVPPEHFAEVEDFAEQNEFAFSPAAAEALEHARSLWQSALLVMPAKKRGNKKPKKEESSTVEIPDDLKDDLA